MSGPWEDFKPAEDGPWTDFSPSGEMDKAREALAKGLNAGERGDPVRAAAWRSNLGVRPANATDVAVSGATMGWGDEASAAIRAPIDMLLRGEDWSDAYAHNVAAERERLDAFKKEHPVQAGLAEFAGSAGGARLPEGLMKVATSIPKIAAQSGLLGAISGAGNAEGDTSGVAQEALEGGAFGVIGGTVAPYAAKAVKALASPVVSAIRGVRNPEGRALDVLRQDLARDKVTVPEARSLLAEAAAEGRPMTIGDLGGRNVMGTARAVATGKGEGSAALNTMHEARRLDAPARVMDDLRATLASPEAFAPTLDAIIAKRQALADPLYKAAYSKALKPNVTIDNALKTPAGQRAAKEAEELAMNEGLSFNPQSVHGVDLMKRAMDDMVESAFKAGRNNEARIVSNVRNKMVAAADMQVPEYRAARKVFSTAKGLEDAIDSGASFLKPSMKAEEAITAIKRMTPAEREVARLGMARQMQSMFDDTSRSLSKINLLLNSGRMRKIGEELFPSGAMYEQFRARLTREAGMLRRGQQVTGGSPTANKLADREELSGIGEVLTEAAKGKFGRAAMSAVSGLYDKVGRGITAKTSDALGEMFASTDRGSQEQILKMLESVVPPRELAKLTGFLSGREAPRLTQKGTSQ